ncbi:MAG TPA: AAA family ATPase [Thermomicrobiales bacterium]|nr:AAA family ATPase [Thermomicrobiales bacterium]
MKILITGMSGTGTTTALDGLSARGWDTIDTDYGPWKIPGSDGDDIWDESRMDRLLAATDTDQHLAISGCVANQGRFYDRFDAVILLTAPIEIMLDRVMRRTTNDYGKTPEQRAEIRTNTANVEPRLRANADLVIDTSLSTEDEVVAKILAFISGNG